MWYRGIQRIPREGIQRIPREGHIVNFVEHISSEGKVFTRSFIRESIYLPTLSSGPLFAETIWCPGVLLVFMDLGDDVERGNVEVLHSQIIELFFW